MEFLNLEHSAAIDSEKAQMQEIFDNAAIIAQATKLKFKDTNEEKTVKELARIDQNMKPVLVEPM